VVNSGESFKIKIKDGAHNLEVTNGPLYLRVLISWITIDPKSTVSYIQKHYWNLIIILLV